MTKDTDKKIVLMRGNVFSSYKMQNICEDFFIKKYQSAIQDMIFFCHQNLRGAFYKFDDLHQGRLNKSSFRRMLDAFMINMNDEEYEKLCLKLGIVKGCRISYLEFLDRFEQRDTAEGHKWLNSVHR